MHDEIEIPNIKGIPIADILKGLKGSYISFCCRYPALNEGDMLEAIRFRNKKLIPALLKKGRSCKAIAKEFGISGSRAWALTRFDPPLLTKTDPPDFCNKERFLCHNYACLCRSVPLLLITNTGLPIGKIGGRQEEDI